MARVIRRAVLVTLGGCAGATQTLSGPDHAGGADLSESRMHARASPAVAPGEAASAAPSITAHEPPTQLPTAPSEGVAVAHNGARVPRADEPDTHERIRPIDGPPGLVVEDPSGQALDAFHVALERAAAGLGQVRIVVYGASHVASDLWTYTVRQALQLRFGDAGHGFILPVKPWRGYRHVGYEPEGDWRAWRTLRVRTGHLVVDRYGLAGVSVESAQAGARGAISTPTDTPVGTSASRFELWFLRQPGGGRFEAWIDGTLVGIESTDAPAPQAGYATYVVPDGPHRFEVRVHGDGPVRLFGLVVERDEPGVVLDTLGINGARLAIQLHWDEPLWREHLQRRRPDLVVLAYGTNEAGDDDVPVERYEAEVHEAVARVRRAVPEASCVLVGPTDRPYYDRRRRLATDRPRTRIVADVMRRAAFAHGCGFFDVQAFMGGPMSMVAWVAADPPLASPDHVHLTAAGYERLGRALLDALLDGSPWATRAVPTELATTSNTVGNLALR